MHGLDEPDLPQYSYQLDFSEDLNIHGFSTKAYDEIRDHDWFSFISNFKGEVEILFPLSGHDWELTIEDLENNQLGFISSTTGNSTIITVEQGEK